MTPGRPPLRANIVNHLDADPASKERLRVLLQNIAGELSVADACNKLHISEARFHELRATMLRAAVKSLEPKPAGRPVQTHHPDSERILELEEQNLDLRVHLAAAQLREEIALVMPHLAQRHPSKLKKKSASRHARTPGTYQITRPDNPDSGSSTPGSSDT